MIYDPSNDPLLEPEEKSTGNFVLMPEGRHNGIIMTWEVDTNWISSNQNKGWKFHLEIDFPQHNTQQQAWLDTSSGWGKQQVQALMAAARVPFDIPDRENLNSDGKARKSYYKALVEDYNEITRIYTFNKDALEGKEALWKIVHKIKCDNCRWLVMKTLTVCSNSDCTAALGSCKIYATIDTTEILPPTEGSNLEGDLKDSIKKENGGDENVPPWVTDR